MPQAAVGKSDEKKKKKKKRKYTEWKSRGSKNIDTRQRMNFEMTSQSANNVYLFNSVSGTPPTNIPEGKSKTLGRRTNHLNSSKMVETGKSNPPKKPLTVYYT